MMKANAENRFDHFTSVDSLLNVVLLGAAVLMLIYGMIEGAGVLGPLVA